MKFINESGSISSELQTLLANTRDFMFIKNMDLQYIAASRNYALECVGCDSVEDVLGKTDFELFADKSIAERYRADDEKLISTGEAMAEFQEEYPDRNGRKHYCLTTKYLIRDEDGNPTGIFGQYHDIEEQVEAEVLRRGQIGKDVLESLAESFYDVRYMDLRKDRFIVVRATDYSKKTFEKYVSTSQAVDAYINTFVKPEYRAKMQEFCDVKTIAERIKGEKLLVCDYLSTVVDGWCRASYYPVELDENGDVTHVIFAVSGVDEGKARELEASIASQKKLRTIFEKRFQILQKSIGNALCRCNVNLTKNTFNNLDAGGFVDALAENSETLDALISNLSTGIFDKEERQKFLETFNREALLEQFERGETRIQLEYFYRRENNRTDMLETAFDLIKDPFSGDVVGICYAKDVNAIRMNEIMLDASLERDYPMAAIIYADTGEFFMYEVEAGDYCVHMQDYWGTVYSRLANAVDGDELEAIRENLTSEKITAYLDRNEEYTYAFYGLYHGKHCRLEVRFRYIDKRHNMILGVLRNITDEELYRQYKYESEHDLLTGLYNRITVFRKSRELMEAHHDEQFIMVYCDVVHFHLYNTFFGEESGDKLLCRIADVLHMIAGDYDYLTYGRIDSDVFCIFVPVKPGLLKKHAEIAYKELDEFSPEFPLELAIGAYWVTDSDMSIEAMFSRASIAAKSGKKNLFGIISRYDDSMEQKLEDTQQITSEMRAAIENEQFEVYLQPKYAIRSEDMVGAEALVRWQHPQRGMISPGKFIPVFEQNGFIAEFDRYMWEHVCQILRRWQDEGRTMYPVSVNMSRVSIYSPTTVPFLKGLIKKYGIDPKYFELELTETAYMDDPEDLKRMLNELRLYGFKILMDDFGSGYSSLNTLRELPVDVLKLDREFLTDSQNDARANAILWSVVRMSKMINLPIIAEGIETREQADYLRDIGCEFAQGFLFARPMPVSDFEQLISEFEISNKYHELTMRGIEKRNAEKEMSGTLLNQIAELQRQNAELQHKLSFLSSAVDNLPNAIFMKGRNAKFVYFNDQYAQNFGMSKEDYIGKTVLDLDYLPEEDRRRYQSEDLQLIETGEVSSYEKDYIFDDGKVHPTLYWSKGFVCPESGEHGLVGEIVDISDINKQK